MEFLGAVQGCVSQCRGLVTTKNQGYRGFSFLSQLRLELLSWWVLDQLLFFNPHFHFPFYPL